MTSQHLFRLLEPLAATLDFVASRGLGLVDVSIRKILIVCPADIKPERFQALAIGDSDEWNRCELKLNPLCLAPLIFRERNGWNRQTIIPTSQVLSMTQAEAGIRGTKAVRLYGRLVYQILSGRGYVRSGTATYTPVAELGQEGNEALRRACVSTEIAEPFKNCQEFWDALNGGFAAHKWSTGWTGRLGSVSAQPSPPTSSPGGPPKRKLGLLIAAIALGASVIGLAIVAMVRFGGSAPKPAVSPGPSVTFVKPSSPPPVVTPQTTPLQSQIGSTPTPISTPANPVSSLTASPPVQQIVGTPIPNSTSPKVVSMPTPSPQGVQINSTPTPTPTPSKIVGVPTGRASPQEIVTAPTPAFTPPVVVATPAPTPIPNQAVGPTATSIPTPTKEQLARKSLEQAYAEEKKGDHNLAARDFTDALQIQPGDQKAYRARGKVYLELKEYEKAIADFGEAIRLKPNDAELYSDRAHTYQHLKQYEKAIGDLTVAIRIEPGNASYYSNRAMIFDAMEDKGRAEQDRAKAGELENNGRASTASATPSPSAIARNAASPTATGGNSGTSFDGTWSVTIVAPDVKDPAGKLVKGYQSQFNVYVHNGQLHGEHKHRVSRIGDYPSTLEMNGEIKPDGSAYLRVNGVSGDTQFSPTYERPGTPYTYEIKVQFAGNRGSGVSIGYRPRTYTFVRTR